MREPSKWDRRAAAMYAAGRSLYAIAKELGVGKTRVKGAIARCGGELRDKGCVGRPRVLTLDERYFDVIDTEEKAYWFGFVTADGCVYRDPTHHRLQVRLAWKDKVHLEKLRRALGYGGKVTYVKNGLKGAYDAAHLAVNSKGLVAALARLGIGPRKAHTVRPCPRVPDEFLTAYWRGVLDGDGCISSTKRGAWVVALVGSRFVCAGFKAFVEAVVPVHSSVRPCNGSFRVYYGGNESPRRILHLLYDGAAVYLDRKYKLAQDVWKSPAGRWTSLPGRELTAEKILAARKETGSWMLAAKKLGVSWDVLYKARHVLGIYKDGRRGRPRRLPKGR